MADDAAVKDTQKATPFERLGGEAAIRRIVERFYDVMETDPAAARIRAMHAADLSVMRSKLADWMIGALGACFGRGTARRGGRRRAGYRSRCARSGAREQPEHTGGYDDEDRQGDRAICGHGASGGARRVCGGTTGQIDEAGNARPASQ